MRAWLRQSGRERFLDDAALVQGREVVARMPLRWIILRAHVEQAALEGLVMSVGVAIVVVADLVEIPEAAVDRKIASPMVLVARERDALARLDLADDVRSAANERRVGGILESVGVDRVFRQHRHQPED